MAHSLRRVQRIPVPRGEALPFFASFAFRARGIGEISGGEAAAA